MDKKELSIYYKLRQDYFNKTNNCNKEENLNLSVEDLMILLNKL